MAKNGEILANFGKLANCLDTHWFLTNNTKLQILTKLQLKITKLSQHIPEKGIFSPNLPQIRPKGANWSKLYKIIKFIDYSKGNINTDQVSSKSDHVWS